MLAFGTMAGSRSSRALVPLVAAIVISSSLTVGSTAKLSARAPSALAESTMCSLSHLPRRSRSANVVAFIGRADGDTVLAGAGSIRYATEGGHYGPGRARPIYGQIIRVDRVDRAAPAALRQAFERGHRSVVLVPWDYAADCERVPWNRSARWLPAGTVGMFNGALRDRAHWVDGRPTLDVTPEVAVYPPAPAMHSRLEHHGRGQLLSAEELFALYELLPDDDRVHAAPDSAIAPVLRWAGANPDLARRPPARDMIRTLLLRTDELRYGRQPSPLVGTWRVVYRAGDGDSVAFFARTELHPTSTRRARGGQDPDTGIGVLRPVIGHALLVQAAPTIATLPVRRGASEPEFAMQGYFQMLDSPLVATADSTVFAGWIDLDDKAARLARDTTTRRALEAAGRYKSALRRMAFQRNEPTNFGRFVITPDGQAVFEMTLERDGAVVLTVRAERVSPVHLLPWGQ
jgi:hypothetical protein